MIIAKHTVVNMHYTLTNDEGITLDSSRNREPLAYIHGVGALIPGLEKELDGKQTGSKVKATIKPEDAYGEWEAAKEHVVPKSGFQGDDELKVGMRVQIDSQGGQSVAMVTKIEGDNVTLDLNHPLAGMTLYFDVEITGVRVATADEISHGHVHGPGGHHH